MVFDRWFPSLDLVQQVPAFFALPQVANDLPVLFLIPFEFSIIEITKLFFRNTLIAEIDLPANFKKEEQERKKKTEK